MCQVRGSPRKEKTSTTIFTIDADNNVTAWPTPQDAEASVAAGAQSFSSLEQLAKLAGDWPAQRLVTIWNSMPGVIPAKGFKSAKTAARKIWDRIQGLEAESPKQRKLKPAKSAPAKPRRKSSPKSRKPSPAAKSKDAAPREGSKKAQVIAMMERKGGATLTEIMKKTGWQQHTVRGFMAGAMKKGGYRVESFKSEGGERSYQLKK